MIPEYFINNVLFLTSVDVFGRTIIHDDLYVGDNLETTLLVEDEKVGILTETPNVEFTVNGQISSNSVIYDKVGNSNNWNSVYSTVCAKSATEWDNSLAQTYANNSFLPLSGGTLTGKLIAAADDTASKLNIGNAISLPEPVFLVNGDIWITSGHRIGWKSGGVTYASAITNLSNTFNQPQIINLTSSVSPALRITQNGSANALVVEDSTNPDATPFVVDNVGSVGIGLSSLSGVDAKLTVVGNVSSTGIIYASGGNSELWNSVYSTVQSNSALWNIDSTSDTEVRSLTSKWESTYSTVQSNSATWGSVATGQFLPLSGGIMTGKIIATADDTASKLNIGNAITGTIPATTVNGDIWITSADRLAYRSNSSSFNVALINRANSFNNRQLIDTSDSDAALRVTQRGSGDAIRVEDATNPDSSPFIVDANGTVGIGLSSLSGIDAKLTVVGNISSTGIIYASGGNSNLWNSVYGLVNSISSNWDSAYSTLYNLSASLEESDEILLTVKNYLSTNNVLICSLDVFSNANIETDLSVGQTLYVGDQSILVPTLYVDETEKVGILTETPNEVLTVVGNISSSKMVYASAVDCFDGIILKSPDNTKWRVVVNNSGVLSTILY